MVDLNTLYSPSKWSNRYSAEVIIDVHAKIVREKSELARKNVPYKTFKYADGTETFLQVFARNSILDAVDESSLDSLDFKGSPVFVNIHGGYWQWGSVFDSSYMAENFTKKGIVVIALGYDLAPSVSMHEIVNQTETAIAKILKIAEKSNSKVFICGHSAGGHLATMILYTDFENKYKVSSSQLAGIISVSGVFDLMPLVDTYVNDNLKMDLSIAKKFSPLLFGNVKVHNNVRVLIVYGEDESPAFKEQSKNYEKHLKDTSRITDIKLICIPQVDHFDIVENLSNDDYSLTKDIYQLIWKS